MIPDSNQADSSVSEEFACGARRCNVVRSAVPSSEWWRDVGAEVVVAAAAAAVVVAVETDGSRTLWHCVEVPVACPEQQDFGGTSNDTRRNLMQEIREKHHGKPQQPGR
jgi:hypothetical protein